jgi:enamine deaminase RidA (YjgF/YER057c/UK114 family)
MHAIVLALSSVVRPLPLRAARLTSVRMVHTEKHIEELGITLPTMPTPLANYQPFTRSGNLVFTAGHIPFKEDVCARQGIERVWGLPQTDVVACSIMIPAAAPAAPNRR